MTQAVQKPQQKPLGKQNKSLQAWFRYVDGLPVPKNAERIDVVKAVRGGYQK
jgi:hypothetical protein